jgi:cytochrome c biogenesis factor
MSLVHNERTKLTATLLNTMAAAIVAAGLFAPAAAAAYGISELRIGSGYFMLVFAVCSCGAALLDWVGRRLLGRLQE